MIKNKGLKNKRYPFHEQNNKLANIFFKFPGNIFAGAVSWLRSLFEGNAEDFYECIIK